MKRLRDLTAVLGMVALTACNNASIEALLGGAGSGNVRYATRFRS